MKKSITCLLLLFAAVSALPAQSETFKVKADINWERDLIRIRVENGLNPDIFVIQEAKLQANRETKQTFPRILLMALEPIVVDSQKTVKDRIMENLTYLNVIESLSQDAFLQTSYLSRDLTSLINEYTVHLYSDFTKIFVNHDTPIPIRPYLGFAASEDYTALVIDATGQLPVYGKAEAAALQPALFPKLLSSNGETVLSQENIEPAVLTERGYVTYYPEGTVLTETEIGKNPLRILATAVFGERHTDIVIRDSEVKKLLGRASNIELLKTGQIHIICNRENLTLSQTLPLEK